jgi:phosphatidylglycerol:prolipoprotein diacylglycerol transferase
MYPTFIEIGPVPIHAYGFMMAIAFVVGMYILRRQAIKDGLNPDVIGDGTFWALIIGLIGSRIAHIMMFPDHYSWKDPRGWIAIWQGGLVFQGALPFGLVFIYYWARRHKIGLLYLLDFSVPVVALGHGIGRLGCFFNGCCYGGLTDSFLGVQFPRVPSDQSLSATGSPAYWDHLRRGLIDTTAQFSLPIHPTQLYSAAGLIAISFALFYLRKHWRPFDGSILATYLMLYGVFRFVLEMVRADHNPTHLGTFTDQQVVSMFLFTLGVVIVLVFRGRGAKFTPSTESSG